jgi:hypothetical protein
MDSTRSDVGTLLAWFTSLLILLSLTWPDCNSI